jgi:hypothetical protein
VSAPRLNFNTGRPASERSEATLAGPGCIGTPAWRLFPPASARQRLQPPGNGCNRPATVATARLRLQPPGNGCRADQPSSSPPARWKIEAAGLEVCRTRPGSVVTQAVHSRPCVTRILVDQPGPARPGPARPEGSQVREARVARELRRIRVAGGATRMRARSRRRRRRRRRRAGRRTMPAQSVGAAAVRVAGVGGGAARGHGRRGRRRRLGPGEGLRRGPPAGRFWLHIYISGCSALRFLEGAP